MNRIAEEEVRELVEGTEGVDLAYAVDTANAIVDKHLASSISETALLNKIELYLAAHFAALVMERGSLIRSATGEAAETYQDLYESGFRSTRFGQQALVLDYTGVLQALSNNTLKAQFRIV